MTEKVKVLIVQNFIPVYREHIYNLVGGECDLIIAHSGKKSKGLSSAKQVILKNRAIGSFNFQIDLIKQLSNQDLVIVMFDLHWVNSIIALFYCRRKKIPFYWWGHGLGSNRLFNHLRLRLIKYSDGLILYSSHSKNLFTNAGIESSKLFLAPNTLHIANSSYDPVAEKKHFLFVGGLRTIKRIPELIKAFALFKKEQNTEDIQLYIVGEGPKLSSYQERAKELDVEQDIIFTGRITDDIQLKELFQKSYAYVSPGDVGLGVLHSFAYGVPVITRHAQGAKHGPEFYNIIHNTNGLIYNGEISSLVKSMKRFIEEKTLTYDMGSKAFDFYQAQRRPQHMIKDIISLINQVKD